MPSWKSQGKVKVNQIDTNYGKSRELAHLGSFERVKLAIDAGCSRVASVGITLVTLNGPLRG